MNFNDESNSISVSLQNLENYCKKMERSPEQLQIEYDLTLQNYIVSSRLTGSYKKFDVQRKFLILSQAAPITNLLNTIQVIYENDPLKKIVIEAEVDDIGLVINSLKVKCYFEHSKTLDLNHALERVINSSVTAEQCNLMSVPVSSLTLNNVVDSTYRYSLTYDYHNTNHKAYREFCMNEFVEELQEITQNLNREDLIFNTNLEFSLLNREKLHFLKGVVSPKQVLDFDGESFDAHHALMILKSLNAMMSWLPKADLNEMQLKEIYSKDNKHYYQSSFLFIGTHHNRVHYEFNLTQETCNGVVNVLNNVVEHFSLLDLSNSAWNSEISVKLAINPSGVWDVKFKDYYINSLYNNDNKQISNYLAAVGEAIAPNGMIVAFNWTVDHGKTKYLKCQISFESIRESFLPMDIDKIFDAASNETFVNRRFQYMNGAYYLVHEDYSVEMRK
ncbi:hypothetical protein [Limosilactobacillus mucosae]|uniref:Uncharacterized protein n=1 Tax=Limosilactobacillus mucosae TaxID=97478 RepID=A0AAJ1HTV2_LIMMU|nr:hypothetical protein [Limosilactobacillus mucosae]MDC2828450.1 hypothetical protein [Limosilactobacillus mucosae]MDC2834348.1 hypothetical protein [Limosilactobacillus mucosae]